MCHRPTQHSIVSLHTRYLRTSFVLLVEYHKILNSRFALEHRYRLRSAFTFTMTWVSPRQSRHRQRESLATREVTVCTGMERNTLLKTKSFSTLCLVKPTAKLRTRRLKPPSSRSVTCTDKVRRSTDLLFPMASIDGRWRRPTVLWRRYLHVGFAMMRRRRALVRKTRTRRVAMLILVVDGIKMMITVW